MLKLLSTQLAIFFYMFFCVISGPQSGLALEQKSDDRLNVDDSSIHELASFTRKFCNDCHGDETDEAGINLEELASQLPLIRNRQTWSQVIEVLKKGSMPPEEELQPGNEKVQQVSHTLDRAINHFDFSQIDDPGFEPIRRLSHTEYNNTIRDLLGVDIKPAERFHSELIGKSGFDNSANTLFLQSTLMERYISAAERVVDEAIPDHPATAAHARTRRLIFVERPSSKISEQAAAHKTIATFLRRAYRRPVSEVVLRRNMTRFQSHRDAGKNYEQSIKPILQAALISPNFLLRIEKKQDGDQPYQIDDWELASRLSYFLWSSMPDEQLFGLASTGQLKNEGEIQKQVARMLRDPKSDSLGEVFAAQWLGFHLIGSRIRFDPIDNPWCTDSLMDAMKEESSLFFMSLLRENRPIENLINANYTFLNHELAETLYDMDGVPKGEMHRVKLDDPNRGGIFSQAATLAVTSNHNRTSPIKRGNWILDTVLGIPVPPPPKDAGELSAQLRRDRSLTAREKLEFHSKNPNCKSCHEKIDPLGFSLENYRFWGQWRQDADANAKLPDGTEFRGPSGLKRVIIERHYDDLIRQLASKMLAFGLGRQLEYYDRPQVEKIVDTVKSKDYRFQSLLAAIVESYAFQFKKNPSIKGL